MTELTDFGSRCLWVALFFPLSALDKILNFDAAVDQASVVASHRSAATLMIVCGFGVEVICSQGVLFGIAERSAALALAAYCVLTALMWKQFWRTPDFKLKGASRGREVFWDFPKNLSLAGAPQWQFHAIPVPLGLCAFR